MKEGSGSLEHPEGETVSKHSKQSSSGSSSTSSASSTSSSSSSTSGRSSSLAQQRRAQYHASSTCSRQNSESVAVVEKRPPLVRAMSAPIRPIDDNSKFLQSSKRKQARKKKVLRDRDEINECDEDAYEDDPVKNNSSNSNATANNNQKVITGGQRSRSVLGGPCDIETLVSLLSSGGSDSEKEDSAPSPTTDSDSYSTNNNNNNNLIGSALKTTARPPMLKKAGKSVSFQESELKQSAGLNRDYYPAGHRKPPALQPIANRIRRSQQLANSLNAFHLKDIKKSSSEESKSDDEKDHSGEDPPPPTSKEQPTKPKKSSTTTAKTDTTTTGQDQLVDGQTPKERECYRLFQKMSNMGLSVSYDTILRGMLTPTELRVLQKQRNKLQKQQESQGSRQNSSESEGNDTGSDTPGGAGKVELPPGLVGTIGVELGGATLLEKYATIVE